MSDNPFEEEPTIVRPVPGGTGRYAAAVPQRPAPPAFDRARSFDAGPVDLPATGASPLLIAAGTLLQLLARLNTVSTPPDALLLRENVVRALQHFRDKARDLGFDEAKQWLAHYALCASIDDIVMNAPWSSQSRWKENSLVGEYHRNVSAGEGFFRHLEQLQRNPSENLPLLELMYYCLSLGFMGRYRPSLDSRGAGQHETLRDEVFEILRRFKPRAEAELSPRWRGEDAAYHPARAVIPSWGIASGVAVCLLAVFLSLSGLLGRSADAVLEAAAASAPPMPVLQRAAAPRPVPQTKDDSPPDVAGPIHRFLQREIAEGLVLVDEKAATVRVQIRASGMFPSAVDTIQPRFLPLLRRIGDALNSEPGRVRIIGHTDNQPVRTVRFHSNIELSAARADAARLVIVSSMRDPGRVTSEGRADLEPITPNANDTQAGREANRRIDVILQRRNETR